MLSYITMNKKWRSEMSLLVDRFDYDWKKVKGNHSVKNQKCVRCNNQVDYFLAWDGSGIGLPGVWTIGFNKVYSYKCPICPNFELINKELAKAILKGVG